MNVKTLAIIAGIVLILLYFLSNSQWYANYKAQTSGVNA